MFAAIPQGFVECVGSLFEPRLASPSRSRPIGLEEALTTSAATRSCTRNTSNERSLMFGLASRGAGRGCRSQGFESPRQVAPSQSLRSLKSFHVELLPPPNRPPPKPGLLVDMPRKSTLGTKGRTASC